MSETISICPICDHQQFRLFLKGKDYFLTQEPFSIVACTACGFRFTNPRPNPVSAETYYQSEAYLSHDSSKRGIIPILYGMARRFNVHSKYNIVKTYAKGNSLLDIGCGTGEFLHLCRQKGLKCTGVEPSAKARNFAQNRYSLDVKADFLTDISPSSRYHCITMWHVLEHIHGLDETMRKLTEVLEPDGVLIVALPNSNAHDATYYGKFWAAFDLPRHIYHFTRETFIKFASKYSLTCITILPQKLDAFYISLLSEKYRTGSSNFVRAVYRGLRSNCEGRNPLTGHSSEIYILEIKNS
ncbi:MAG: class I SAM-dependent methyltransferase [Bacteroidetes bacterium]|nr:MAG: class I SAM-dependent methyltransferase [Bacteroidota bacterium]